MPKNRPLPRCAYIRSPAVNADGKISGWDLVPGSVPPQALSVQSLSAITADLGICTSGTLRAGAPHGARVVVGDEANGIVAYNANEQPFFSLSWLNESLRIGRPGLPGVRIRDGNVEIDGNAVVDGTLTAAKLIAGEIATRLLEADKLFIGTGDPDASPLDITGFLASAASIGGYAAGVLQWKIDTATGKITVTGDNGGEILLGGDEMRVSNTWYSDESFLWDSMITLRTKYWELVSDEGGSKEYTYANRDVKFFTICENVVFLADTDSMWPSITLRANTLAVGAELGKGYLELHDMEAGGETGYIEQHDEYMALLTPKTDIRFIPGLGTQYTEVKDDRVSLLGQTFRLGPDINGEWQPIPGMPDYPPPEGTLWWDHANRAPVWFDGLTTSGYALKASLTPLEPAGLVPIYPIADISQISLMQQFMDGGQ